MCVGVCGFDAMRRLNVASVHSSETTARLRSPWRDVHIHTLSNSTAVSGWTNKISVSVSVSVRVNTHSVPRDGGFKKACSLVKMQQEDGALIWF